jgi:thiol-disulfide isomerase/thioredoxin
MRRIIYAYAAGLACFLPALAATAQTHIPLGPTSSSDASDNNWDVNPFSLQYADGRTLTSDQLRGKMVFIDAWATWCAPCMPSLPKFGELYNKNIGNPDVKVISVHLSDRYGRFDNAAQFLRSKGLYYPVLQDPEGSLIEDIDVFPLSTAVPHYVLLDGSGKIIRRYGEINDKVILDVQNRFDKFSRTQKQKAPETKH